MSAPTDTTLVQRTEWVLGIGEPKPPSRFALAGFTVLATLGIGTLIWSALSGERINGADAPMTGITFVVAVVGGRDRRVVPLRPPRGVVGQGPTGHRARVLPPPLHGVLPNVVVVALDHDLRGFSAS